MERTSPRPPGNDRNGAVLRVKPSTKPDSPRVPLAVTRYEQTAARLITALILVGAAVLLLFLMWLTTRVWVRPTAIEPQLIEPLAGGGNAIVRRAGTGGSDR